MRRHILEKRDRWTMLFLFLDECLGEYGTQNWIGRIEFSDSQLKEAMPLAETRRYIAQVGRETGWKKFDPGSGGHVYRFKEPHDRFPRGDLVIGSTVLENGTRV